MQKIQSGLLKQSCFDFEEFEKQPLPKAPVTNKAKRDKSQPRFNNAFGYKMGDAFSDKGNMK